MTVPLLVVTADIPFGELLRKGLEETGRFGVRVTGDQDEAVAYVQEMNCPLAFLDAATEEEAMVRIGRALRLINSEIRFVVISEVGWHSALEKLFPLYYLSKPFHFPDLFEMMDKFFPAAEPAALPEAQAPTEGELPWLANVNRAAQHLTRLTLESSAQAALITREGQLWAYAGQLPQTATSELAAAVARYWDRKEQSDLVRFVRLTSTNAEHMLYATRLSEGMVLALVFDAETPFSTIRSQANQLVHSLSASPADEKPKEEQVEEEAPQASLADILADVPSPNPVQQLAQPAVEAPRGTDSSVPSLEMPRLEFMAEPSVQPQVENVPAEADRVPQLDETQALPRQTKSQKKRELNSEDLAETLPGLTPEGGHRIVLEPVSPSVYNLTYDCLFIPRFTTHYLTGDLADRLSDWLQQICVAFGWRLEYISVRPDYLQWIVNVSPVTSPAYLMRILRQQTSEKIFDEFPRFKKENPSGDFWAPGYLIMVGSQPAPAQLIKDFTAQTRQRQGITPPLR
jgi:REP element-mobilizing transposase RayT/ActR/RegA family two-component response regulator